MKKWIIFYIFVFFRHFSSDAPKHTFRSLIVIYSVIAYGLAVATNEIVNCAKSSSLKTIQKVFVNIFIVCMVVNAVISFLFLQAIIVDFIELGIFLGHKL